MKKTTLENLKNAALKIAAPFKGGPGVLLLAAVLFCAATLPARFGRYTQVIVQPRSGDVGSNVLGAYNITGSNGYTVGTNGATVVRRNGTNNPVVGGGLGDTNFTLAKTNQVFVIRDGRIVAIE